MICYKCGKETGKNIVAFCPHCGAYINRADYDKKFDLNNSDPVKKIGFFNRPFAYPICIFLSFVILLTSFMTAAVIKAYIFSGITLCLGTFLVGSMIFSKKRSSEYSDDIYFDDTFNTYLYLPTKTLTKRFIQEEINTRKNENVKLESKTAVKRRFIYTLAFSLLTFLLLNSLYYKYIVFPLMCILCLVYEILILNTTTCSTIYRMVIKNPDKSISDIVNDETYNEIECPKRLKNLVASCAVIFIAVFCFVIMHTENKYQFKKVDDGYAIESYRPGLFQKQIIDVPENIDGKKIVSISKKAFASNIYLKDVSLPSSIRSIEDGAFSGCVSLDNIDLNDEITKIGSRAFKNCKSLEKIILSKNLKELNGEAFKKCSSLIEITIPEGVTEIRGNTFEDCSKLESVVMHDGIIDIHAYAFNNCHSLKNIVLPPQITEIHTYTFANCDSLEYVDIPRGVTRIAARAFFSCDSLSEVFIPDTVTEIGSSAFRECESLREIQLPEDVNVNEKAFKDSPTVIRDKNFTDEISDKIGEELQVRTIEKLYGLYKIETGKDVVYSYYGDKRILVVDSIKIKETFSDDESSKISTFQFSTPTEFLQYLKKARENGFEEVVLGRYSEVATEVKGYTYLAAFYFDIDELIESYEEDASEF